MSAQVAEDPPHELVLDIHDFNGLAAQRFTGYLATESRGLIAGYTRWREERYGFYARRDLPRPLAAFRSGEVAPPDFAGLYTLRCDGGPAALELLHVGDRRLSGHWRPPGGEPHQIDGEIDQGDPLLVRLTLSTPAGPATLTGSLFSRPKNVIAGWIDLPAARIPCYLLRIG
ncbi:hypothetical protein ACIBKY_46205 [Nonomuraea sp. NPDC050394]|uniref:hypothetical protein n=1 Tax=Nonomuraea sp. NPDC050394 TaxID=3364363 RepID=UPI003792E089